MEERQRAGRAGCTVREPVGEVLRLHVFELELLEAEVLGDAAYTVGFEHTFASVDGVPRTYTLCATQIYRREDGGWKVAHRHGSAPRD